VRAPDQATRQRLLEAAAHLFAARGFRRVTIREICRAARANVAAVNYHFRDKQGLYGEVLELAIAVMQETTTATKQASADGSPEARLRAHIRIFLERLLGGGGDTWLHRLMTRELADPTPAFDVLVDRGVRPRVEYVAELVGELTGLLPTDERVERCVASVQAQCIMALPNRVAERLRPNFKWTPVEIQKLAGHIAEFSLAGIRAIGRQT
jgi:AcrR family transcriptional regulator